jgi:hypothetical protein
MMMIDRFDTTTEKDMKLNAVDGKGVVDGPSSRSGNRGGRAILHHISQLLEAEAAWDAFRGINEREMSRAEGRDPVA